MLAKKRREENIAIAFNLCILSIVSENFPENVRLFGKDSPRSELRGGEDRDNSQSAV